MLTEPRYGRRTLKPGAFAAILVGGAILFVGGFMVLLQLLLPEEYAGLTRGRAYGVAVAAVANQRGDAETILPAGGRHGRVLGRSAWVFEFATVESQRFCVYVWWQRGANRGSRSILGECRT